MSKEALNELKQRGFFVTIKVLTGYRVSQLNISP
jgi:hypothetical protein